MAFTSQLRGITTKLLAIELAAFVAAALVVSGIFLLTQSANLQRQEIRDFTRAARLISLSLSGPAGDELAQIRTETDAGTPAHDAWRERLASFESGSDRDAMATVIRWEAGQSEPVVLVSLEDTAVGEPLPLDDQALRDVYSQVLIDGVPTGTTLLPSTHGEGECLHILAPLRDSEGSVVGALALEIDGAAHYQFLSRLFLVFLSHMGIMFVLIAGLTFALSFTLTRPLSRLVRATRALGQGDFEHPVRVRANDEIGDLAATFETMREDLLALQRRELDSMRLSTVGRMASGIIHDFKSPMTAIGGYAQLLAMPDFDDDQREEFSVGIQHNIDVMVAMTRDLLDYSRGESTLRIGIVSMHEFIEEVAETARQGCTSCRVVLLVDCSSEGAAIVDEVKLRRVILNLITNAREAMSDGGEIRLISRCEEGKWLIEVRDNGPGIPEEIRATLFEPFATHGKATGTGLGLTLARQFVEQHGGHIRFETEAGRGTSFFIEIPIDEEALAGDQAEAV